MGIFEDLKRRDVVAKIAPMIESGDLNVDKDTGKIICGPLVSTLDPELPWIFADFGVGRQCWKWEKIYFGCLGMIPKGCFKCWKVVCKVQTLKELFKLYDLQQELGLPGKCGVERRPYNKYGGIYSGFWYCPMDGGLEGARKYFEALATKVAEKVSVRAKVILKRGCTEMENAAGPSNEWQRNRGMEELEDFIDPFFDIRPPQPMQNELFRIHCQVTWIEWAFANVGLTGDPTLVEFVDRFPESFGVRKTVLYHSNDLVPDYVPEEAHNGLDS